MKKKVPVLAAAGVGAKKRIQSAVSKAQTVQPGDIGLTDNDCICETMAAHCPVHAMRKFPAIGQDVIR